MVIVVILSHPQKNNIERKGGKRGIGQENKCGKNKWTGGCKSKLEFLVLLVFKS